MKVMIGTSGWMYDHWKGLFYPPDCAKSKWLEYYSGKFHTVELNATFYRLPQVKVFENWKKRTPANFVWAVKANRYITHVKRLKDVEEPIQRMYNALSRLQPKLGPILFQLPPGLLFDETLLEDFCENLDDSMRHAMEVRHVSWINNRAFDILQRYKVAFCISDTAGRYPFHEVITSDFVYIRLHGPRKLYASEYTDEEIYAWADKIMKWRKDAFVYFDNDYQGYAVKNAQKLRQVLESVVFEPEP